MRNKYVNSLSSLYRLGKCLMGLKVAVSTPSEGNAYSLFVGCKFDASLLSPYLFFNLLCLRQKKGYRSLPYILNLKKNFLRLYLFI